MANKLVLLFGIVVILPMLACSNANAKEVSIEVVSNDPLIREDLYKNFSILLHQKKTDVSGKVLLSCENGVVSDSLGRVLFEPSEHLSFWAYKVIMKKDERTGFPSEVILEPYFNNGDNVGDSITLEWDSINKNYIRAFANIP